MDIAISQKETGNIFQYIYEKKNIVLIFLFIMLNTLKITVFNMFLTSSASTQEFLYKAGVTFAVSVLVYLLLLKVKSRFAFAAFYILQAAYILVNIIYFMYFHSFLHIAQAFALASESVGGARDLSVILNYKLLIVLIDAPLAVYMIIKYKSIRLQIKDTEIFKRAAVILSCLFILAAAEGWNLASHNSISQLKKTNSSTAESMIVKRYGTLANSLADLTVSGNDSKLIKQLNYGQNILYAGKNTDSPNFVVIQVESMDSNSINAQHNGQYVMPFMHSLSKSSVYYPYMMSYHEAGGTSDCEFSTMNSTEPLSNYPIMEVSDYSFPNSIVRQLSNNSYTTVAFHGDVGNYYQRDAAYPKMGYNEFYDLNKMGLQESGWGAPDGDVFKYAENKLKTVKKPFFAYTITMTSHGPFINANNYYNNSNYNDIKDATSRNYMNSMSYVDKSLESYINYIRSNFKNTYIIIYGDHTPDVNSSYYSQASYTEGGRYFEFVPLVIVTPDQKVIKEETQAASFIDIAPTIAKASGIPCNIKSNGADLINRYNMDSKIYYRGGEFDRSHLYDMVSKTMVTP